MCFQPTASLAALASRRLMRVPLGVALPYSAIVSVLERQPGWRNRARITGSRSPATIARMMA